MVAPRGPIQDPAQFALDLVRGRDDWRALLERDYAATSARLQQAYRATLGPLQLQQSALMSLLQSAPTTMTAQQVADLAEFQNLIARIDAEMTGFARLTRQQSATLGNRAITHGSDAALGMVMGQVPDARILAGVWMRPDPAALAQLASYADGDAMRVRASQFGENAARNYADTLLALTAQGRNPRDIARRMTQWFQFPYAWADNQVRTSQIYSYRTANHASYRANDDVVRGWLWRAALDIRTCLSCVSQHGSQHGNDETLNDHHRGRCAPIPIVRGTTWADDIETGEVWFNRQSPAQQREMMGPGLYEAWRRGDVRFGDLSRPYQDDVYGTMMRQASLRELGVRGPRDAPPTAAPGPQGTPVGSALRISEGRFEDRVNEVIGQIDALHGDGVLPTIPVKSTYLENDYGQFVHRDGAPVAIQLGSNNLARDPNRVGTTTTHEVGHFLDFSGMGTPRGVFASQQAAETGTGPLARWWQVVSASPEVQTLQAMRDDPAQYPLRTSRGIQTPVQAEYFSRPREIWARSYAQYIARRSGDPAMARVIESERAFRLYRGTIQWSDESFAPVADAIDDAFRELGWMT